MQIDWFTVGAQLVNFVVLFALLSKFLYQPIVDAIDSREARIASRLEEAERREEEAERERSHYENLQNELEAERDELMDEAVREAERRRKELLDEVRTEVQRSRNQWYERLRHEQSRLLNEFSRRLEEEIFRTSREVLAELADVRVAAKIVDRFTADLESAEVDALDEMRAELSETDATVEVHTSFELDDAERNRLEDALEGAFDRGLEVDFELDSRLVAGIELRIGGHRFGWNIESYLDSLRAELRETIETDAQAPPAPVRATGEGIG